MTIIPPYKLPGHGTSGVPNVVPFTYRDGYTFLERFEDFRKYVTNTVVPWMQENYGDLAEAFETEVNALIAQWTTIVADLHEDIDEQFEDQNAQVDLKVQQMLAELQEAVQQVINAEIEVSDPIIAGALADNQSLSAKRIYELSTEETLRPNLEYKTVSLNIRPDWNVENYRTRIQRIAAHGGGVVLCIYDTIPNATAITFTRTPQTLVDGVIALCEEYGVEIAMIKPHIVTPDQGDGFYRGNYNPPDKAGFFANWRQELLYFAQICNDNNIPILCLSCEQAKLTTATYYQDWATIISYIRASYPNLKLTAAFTTAELFDLYQYWIPQNVNHMASLLDIYGINSWIKLTDKVYDPANPNAITNTELVSAFWNTAQNDIHQARLIRVCTTFNIPYFVTEIGCRPYLNGLQYQAGGGTFNEADKNHDVQGILYQAIFDGIANSDMCVGVSIWHVDGPFNYFELSEPDVIYPGEAVIRKFYKQEGVKTA